MLATIFTSDCTNFSYSVQVRLILGICLKTTFRDSTSPCSGRSLSASSSDGSGSFHRGGDRLLRTRID